MSSPIPRFKLLAVSMLFVAAILCVTLLVQKLSFVPDAIYVGDHEQDLLMKPRTIGIALFQYANDHGDKYPEGHSSTEIFQKLLDGKYILDPSVFYYSLSGKDPAQSNHLKPQNVCWDVTEGIDATAPDNLPVVFLTGYKIIYRAGAKAQLLPEFTPSKTQKWMDWWNKGYSLPGLLTSLCNTSNQVRLVDVHHESFIPADFDPKGKTYRQLTPDGELPP